MEIERTTFGTITIDGKTYEHDVIIRLSGEVARWKKKLIADVCSAGKPHCYSITSSARASSVGGVYDQQRPPPTQTGTHRIPRRDSAQPSRASAHQ